MESVSPKFVPSPSKIECTRTDNVISPFPEISTGLVALLKKFLLFSHVFPGLCTYFNDFVYPDPETSSDLANGPMDSTVTNFLETLKDVEGEAMNSSQKEDFKMKLTTYASRNLIRIKAFMESPYVTSFLTQEVTNTGIMVCIMNLNFN